MWDNIIRQFANFNGTTIHRYPCRISLFIKVIFGTAITHLPKCFCPPPPPPPPPPPRPSFRILDWTCCMLIIGLLYVRCILSSRIFYMGSSRLCNWLSLHCLVLWIDHLPPVCWSTFWKFVLNDSWFVSLGTWDNGMCCKSFYILLT